MANDKRFIAKNGLQTQNLNFVDSNSNNAITASMLTSDVLSFSGNTGQLFSISDSMTGTIFAVNDISGIPSIEVLDTGTVKLAEISGNVGIGNSAPTTKLSVNGTSYFGANVTIVSALTANGSVGTAGQVLTSNATGIYWSTLSAATNLTLTSNSSTVSINSDTGTDVVILEANTTTAGLLTANTQTIAGAKTFTIGVLANDGIYADQRKVGVNESANALAGYTEVQQSGNTVAYAVTGVYSDSVLLNGAFNNTSALGIIGVESNAYVQGNAGTTVSKGIGIRSDISSQNTKILDATAFQARHSGVFGAYYGFKQDPITFGSANTSYAFYANFASAANTYNFYANGTAVSYFGGNVGIANTAPAHKLSVNGTSYLSGDVTLTSTLTANGSVGTAGQVLTSTATGVYWSEIRGAWISVANTYTASSGDAIMATTTAGSFTVTLPSSPLTGAIVVIADGNDFLTNPLTVNGNGKLIEGYDTFTLNVKNVKVEFIYSGTSWQAFPTITVLTADSNTDLTLTANSSAVSINSSTGTDVIMPAANTTTAGIITTNEQTFYGTKSFQTVNVSNVGIGITPTKLVHAYRNNSNQDAQVQVEQAGSGSPTLGFLKTGVFAWLTGLHNPDNSYRIAASGADLNTSTALAITTSGNLQFNSGYGSVATAYGCRAWVNFNGTGTPAIRSSGNVSSITDNGVGLYTVNFTTAMPDTNFAVACSGGDYTTGTALLYIQERNAPGLRTVNSIAVSTGYINTGAAALQDNATNMVAVFR